MDILHGNTTLVVTSSIPHPVDDRLPNRPWLSGSQEHRLETHRLPCIQILLGLYTVYQTGHASRRERGHRMVPDSQ